MHLSPLRLWWTKSPLKSAQKSTLESKPLKKRSFESISTLLSVKKCAQTRGLAQKSAHVSEQLKKELKRVGYSKEY